MAKQSSIYVLKPIMQIKDADEARYWAINWQQWASEQALSYSELADFQNYFEALGKKFNLTEEFNENGII